MMTVTIVAMEVLYAPYTCDQHHALLADSPPQRHLPARPLTTPLPQPPFALAPASLSRSSSIPLTSKFPMATRSTLFPAALRSASPSPSTKTASLKTSRSPSPSASSGTLAYRNRPRVPLQARHRRRPTHARRHEPGRQHRQVNPPPLNPPPPVGMLCLKAQWVEPNPLVLRKAAPSAQHPFGRTGASAFKSSPLTRAASQ